MIDITKRIFITWATGFIGANILHQLILLWARDVHILVRKNSNLARIQNIQDKIVIHVFSLEDREETLRNILEIKPQIIYHISALGTAVGRVPCSIDDLIQSNTLWSIHLLDAAIEAWCECFVNTWSSSEYGVKDAAMCEDMSLEPNNLYGISKAAATQYATFIWKIKHFPVITYRIFSAYGPYEDPARLIPTILSAYRHAVPPELTSPYPVRDYIFILDIVNAYLHADKAIKIPWDVINLWTWIQSTIDDVVQIVKRISNSDIEPIYGNRNPTQHEPKYWFADWSKMRNILWIVPISLEQWLRSTFEYNC